MAGTFVVNSVVCFFVRDLATENIVHYEVEEVDLEKLPIDEYSRRQQQHLEHLRRLYPMAKYDVFKQGFSSLAALNGTWPELRDVTSQARHGTWLEVAGGPYDIGLHEDEARAFATIAARQARDTAREPDALHGLREDRARDDTWGNADDLYTRLAMSMPAHRVTLPAFALSSFPVSIGEYAAFRAATGAALPARAAAKPVDPSAPVTGVSWAEATAYAAWAKVELPSEAQWEAAMRPSRSPYGTIGHELYEWCADEFHPYPGADAAAIARVEPPPGGWAGKRVTRASSIGGFPPNVVTRDAADPALRLTNTTFRVVRRS
ncbi:MAG TPA: SUMF1/EgtB/PvdO family nonheme iron enzyme [Kofleriaceae bacterium]|jgi:formylglycine-generating enzyme required for sulfatase activity